MRLSELTYDDVAERALFALDLDSFAASLQELRMPSPHFVCLLAADFRDAADADISHLAAHLFDSGACYFVCWGPDCERAHDLIDGVLLARAPEPTHASVILTTWHDDESLDDALDFFLTTCWPAEAYLDAAGAALAITVQDGGLARRVRESLVDPRAFVARVSGADDHTA